jgi:pimeloyl-ACP methyl ester carboxylesterase
MRHLVSAAMNRAGGVVDHLFMSGLKIGQPLVKKGKKPDARYIKEIQFYADKGYLDNPETFFSLADGKPDHAVIRDSPRKTGRRQTIAWLSGYQTRSPLLRQEFQSYSANRTAYLIRWTHGDMGRKTVLCLHGFMLGEPRQAGAMFKVGRLLSMGLDVALLIAPFHWRRSTGSPLDRSLLIQPDNVTMTVEGFGQAVWDLSSALHVLRHLGAGETGVVGASLGGFYSALFACLSEEPSFCAMMVPAVSFQGAFGPQPKDMPRGADAALRETILRLWDMPSPLHLAPKMTKDRILVVASQGDRLCPFEHILELCGKWGWPGHRFLTGGHWLMLDAKERGRAWYSFLDRMGFGA